MASKIFLISCYLALLPFAYCTEFIRGKEPVYLSKVDEIIDDAINQFEREQFEKMTAGFTTRARKSYKKTK